MNTMGSKGILGVADVQHVCGIVLAGAYSWSNSAFDRLVPRPLLPVAGWPLIAYTLGWLEEGGVHNAVVCTNRDTRSLHSRLAPHLVPAFKTLVYREDPMPRGPAGCARDAASESDADTFIVADGTALPSVDLSDLLHRHRASGAALTVVVYREAARRGDSSRQIPCGTYIVERRALNLVKAVGYFDIKENLIPLLYKSGEQVLTYQVEQPSPRVLDLPTYLSANEWMVQRLVNQSDSSNRKSRGGSVADDAVLIGPVLLGRGVTIMSGATIVGPTSIGEGTVVNSGALVSRSAVWNDCTIGQDAVADRCLLGDRAVVEPRTHEVGTVKAGRRLEPQIVRATRDRSSFADLVRRKFAAKPVQKTVKNSATTAVVSS